MIAFPDINPVAVQLGPLAIHWYGLAYIAGIGLAWWLLLRRSQSGNVTWTEKDVGDLVFWAALGAVLGGRVGYALFYNAGAYLDDPTAVFAVWRGGMSFHGGVLGFIFATAWFARSRQRPFLEVSDFLVPVVPVGLGLGRVANFVNQELWGAPTELPWGVVFTNPAAGLLARHPSQLYEAILEGAVLFAILAWVTRVPRRTGVASGVFLFGYGCFRCLVEFVREPDAHIGFLADGWVTMGQVLSLPMVLTGAALLALSLRRS